MSLSPSFTYAGFDHTFDFMRSTEILPILELTTNVQRP